MELPTALKIGGTIAKHTNNESTTNGVNLMARKEGNTPGRRRTNAADAAPDGQDAHDQPVINEAAAKILHAIDVITGNCGEQARKLLLSGHRFVTPKILIRLKNSSPQRQRFEIEQLRQGIRPFSAKTTTFDTLGYGEVIS